MAEKNTARDFGDEYAFWEDVEFVIPEIKHNVRPHGNQGKNKETSSACTIVWAVNQLIRLFALDLDMEKTNKLYIEVVKYCEKLWYSIGEWWSTPTACNSVCKWWNEIWYKAFKKEKVFWNRLYWSDWKIVEALKKWHIVWFTKNVNFSSDQVEWLVYHEATLYPKSVWHRLNRAWVNHIKATGWADISKAERWAVDNYHGQIGEFFAFKEMKPYINHGVYAYWYLILPESCMKTNIEEEKKRIARMKAVNATIWVLTSTRWDMEEAFQELSSSYAQALRDEYKEARPKEEDQSKKVYQAIVDILSYSWKFAGEEEQEKYSELANFLRKKHNLN